ncbi:unnamed protein product [Moneuplotes crassus]|uniref:Uncharacterized protein n=1 Tax=Euplotes crassus TaxID=5936 RepID=A0AAD1UHV3_EUPCR|nr:unnamed protein product [Moneuplotes crassus]
MSCRKGCRIMNYTKNNRNDFLDHKRPKSSSLQNRGQQFQPARPVTASCLYRNKHRFITANTHVIPKIIPKNKDSLERSEKDYLDISTSSFSISIKNSKNCKNSNNLKLGSYRNIQRNEIGNRTINVMTESSIEKGIVQVYKYPKPTFNIQCKSTNKPSPKVTPKLKSQLASRLKSHLKSKLKTLSREEANVSKYIQESTKISSCSHRSNNKERDTIRVQETGRREERAWASNRRVET